MGLIRKTLSISTLGLVGWKSKRERLADAEEELTLARAGLERTQAELRETAKRRERLEKDLRSARSDLDATGLSALSGVRSARRKGRWEGRLRGRKGALSGAKERVAPLVASALDAGARVAGDAEPVVDDVRVRGRRARKRAERRAEELRTSAQDHGGHLRDRAARQAADLRTRAERRADELRYRTTGRSKRFGTRFRVFGRKAAKQARHRADDARGAASEARQAVADRTRR